MNALVTYFYRSFPQVDTLDLRFRYNSIQTKSSLPSSDKSDVAYSSVYLLSGLLSSPVLYISPNRNIRCLRVGLKCLYSYIRKEPDLRGKNNIPEYMDINNNIL